MLDFLKNLFVTPEGDMKWGTVLAAGGAGIAGWLLGGSVLGALVGVVGGTVLGSLINSFLNPELPGPDKLPRRLDPKMTPQDPIREKKQLVERPENKGKDEVLIAETLLERLKVPSNDISTMNRKRKEAENAALKKFKGEMSASDLQCYEQAKKDLEKGDRELGQYLMNFHKYDTERNESKELAAHRKHLVLVLKRAGMSEEDIKKKIPMLPRLPDNARIPALDECDYDKGLALYAAKEKKPTEAVKKEWDELGSFAQLNSLRDKYADDMLTYWKQGWAANATMYGNRELNGNYYRGSRQDAHSIGASTADTGDIRGYSAGNTVLKGIFTLGIGNAIDGQAENNCRGQSYCAKAIADLMQRDPDGLTDVSVIKTNSGMAGHPAIDTLEAYDIPICLNYSHCHLENTSGKKWTNCEYMAHLAAVGLNYAKYHGDHEAEMAYKKVLLFCQACVRRRKLDEKAAQMDEALHELNTWRDTELKKTNESITEFQKTDLTKLNQLIKARSQAGYAITRKVQKGNEALIIIDDFSQAGQRRQIMLRGTITADGLFTVKQLNEHPATFEEDDEKQFLSATSEKVASGWKNLASPATIDLNSISGIRLLKDVITHAHEGAAVNAPGVEKQQVPEPSAKAPRVSNTGARADKDGKPQDQPASSEAKPTAKHPERAPSVPAPDTAFQARPLSTPSRSSQNQSPSRS